MFDSLEINIHNIPILLFLVLLNKTAKNDLFVILIHIYNFDNDNDDYDIDK